MRTILGTLFAILLVSGPIAGCGAITGGPTISAAAPPAASPDDEPSFIVDRSGHLIRSAPDSFNGGHSSEGPPVTYYGTSN